ncbi:hypothetical protein DY000_02037451 [Brassica cretica]|uniref:Uncharacterized protein n=1 Tax=Brassica cretica TaxID=69181 RepID=A0ABQ7BNW0_BRACR|nr:hypothetical protein DY000_02037451 [Brassica cretica]
MSGKMLFERTEHRNGLRERPTTPAPDETKTVRPLCTGVRHLLRAQPFVDNFREVERPGGATS